MAPSAAQPSGAAGPVTSLLAPVVQRAGLVLEDVTITPAGKRRVVRVVVDLPEDRTGSLDLDAVAEVSRSVSEALDSCDVLGGAPYVLEVGTPGVDRPLTERRHWSRARTRLVEVPVDGAPLTGRVLAVGDGGVGLEVDGVRRTLAWEQLGTGRVQVEFRRPGEDGTGEDGQLDDGHDEAKEG